MVTVFRLAEWSNVTGKVRLLDSALSHLENTLDPIVVFSLVGYDAAGSLLWPMLRELVEEKLPKGTWEDVSGPPVVAPDRPSKPCIWGLLLDAFDQKSHHVRVALLVPHNSQLSEGSEVTSNHDTTLNRVTTLLSICSAQLNLVCDEDNTLDQTIQRLEGILDFSPLVTTQEGLLGEIVMWNQVACDDGLLSTSRSANIGDVGKNIESVEELSAYFKQIRRRNTPLKQSMDGSLKLNPDAFIAEELRNLALDQVPSSFDSIARRRQISDFVDEIMDERTVRQVLQLRETVNGPTLALMLRTSLLQINAMFKAFNLDTWQETLSDNIQKDAIACGTGTYHRVLNGHLDRHPLPVTWHNLMFMHQDAQQQALEEIERRYYTTQCNLSILLRTFRSHCLETRTLDNGSFQLDTPITEGLYSEYYMANAHELQMHHMAILDEHWQQYVKSRLTHRLTSLPATLSPPTISTRPSASLPDIKNLTEFLVAVDSVRKNYLQICIPSPEAIAVLESLEEMQQAEVIFFLQGTLSKPIPPSVLSLSTPTVSGLDQYDAHSMAFLMEGREEPFARTEDFRSILSARRNSTQEQTTNLEYHINEILQAKRRNGESNIDLPLMTVEHSSLMPKKESETKMAVQFGWTFHMLHANTLQYSWIWSRPNHHSESFGQNMVGCDSKLYTASKWILLPAKDTVPTRKDWKVSYGDRVWLASYWFSTRNANMDLPEYLPLARGAPCRHIIPYGEIYVICKTCPADVLCMRCFKASDHTDHTMYLQCSWGTSVCLCNDFERVRLRQPHCSIHSAEPQPPCSHASKGKRCNVMPESEETSYHCKKNPNDNKSTQRHHGRGVASMEGGGVICTCADSNTNCAYHSSRLLEPEYQSLRSQEYTLPSRCGYIFKPGEYAYHCQDCSVNEMVATCSRCFHASACVDHQWRFFHVPSETIESHANDQLASNSPRSSASCNCGDPDMFKVSFDCNYHLPIEFRPVPNLHHCNHLFKKNDIMFHCRTCYHSSRNYGREGRDLGIDAWICKRCFDPAQHLYHQIEQGISQNEGHYCHCGDQAILRTVSQNSTSEGFISLLSLGFNCKDDHFRQNVLCATEIEEGMFYYACKSCQTDSSRIFCETCFVVEAHEGHRFERACATSVMTCACGENSAFRFATHCSSHERSGGTNIIQRCRYIAKAGEWIAHCSDCYSGNLDHSAYLCRRCHQGSDHTGHDVSWVQIATDCTDSCACGSLSLCSSNSYPSNSEREKIIPLCKYHTMTYKTTPTTTLYLHHKSSCENEVTGNRYHDSDNDWIITQPDQEVLDLAVSEPLELKWRPKNKAHLQWKDVFWLQHANTGRYLNIANTSQGLEVSVIEGPCSNNGWIAEETTWLRQQILSE